VRISDRLQKLLDLLPEQGAIMLPCSDVRGWLAEDAEEAATEDLRRISPDPDVAQLCELFKRSPSTVRGWIRSGQLKAYRSGRGYRATPEAIEAFKATEREQPASAPPATQPDLSRWRKAS
jgi:excisionase family DNA binding protein